MCGIFAIINSRMDPIELRRLALKLSKMIRHRGPDCSGIVLQTLPNGNHSAVAHERLAIVDPRSGKQPLGDSTGTVWVTVNGEIYNHVKLRDEKLDKAETDKILSHSDCAVIPSLVKRYGTDFIPWLDGKFAFVASDSTTGRIIAARDPIGLCPLYIGWGKDGSICFASELKCLTEFCYSFDLFPPGHFYDWTPGVNGPGEAVRYYNPTWWALDSPIPSTPLDLGKLRDAVEAAVEKRTMSDVPYGVLLSGGLDSSLIAAILTRKFKSIQDDSVFHKVMTFSVGLAGSPDLLAARKVAEYLQTDHQEVSFTVQEGIDHIRDVVYQIESYDVTTIRASLPMYFLARVVRSMGIKFVFSGEAADEVLGGYLYFHYAPNKEELHRETQRKIHDLHYYDLLRASKAPMGFGLEVRAPFLDKEFLDIAMTIDPSEKMCKNGRVEKWILRTAFKGYLPDETLWRQKEQLSDGVGYAWIDGLKERAERIVSDQEMKNAKYAFRHNTPLTKEAYWYRRIFYELFPHKSAEVSVLIAPSIACSTSKVMHWHPSFASHADQSGRSVVGVHQATKAASKDSSPAV